MLEDRGEYSVRVPAPIYNLNEPRQCVNEVGAVLNPPSESYNFEEEGGYHLQNKLINKCLIPHSEYIQTQFTKEKSSQCRGFQFLLISDLLGIGIHAI